MMKILMGGSPCTHWSIAQTKNRETEPKGLGWELFKNYLIALEKFKPDYFLYENNKSMSPAIREQITKELGVEPILINSAVVSAQNRNRLYWTNIPGVEQPENRGILLRDILESGAPYRAYDATPIRVGDMPNAEGHVCGSQSKRIYSVDGKAKTICASGSGDNSDMGSPATGLYAVPCDCDVVITENSIRCQRRDKKHSTVQGSHVNFEDGKSQTLSPSHIPQVIEANYEIIEGAEILIANGKIRQGDDKGSKQGKYVYTELADKSNTISAGQAHNEKVLVKVPDGTWKNVYEVRDGMITIKGKQYPIKLTDGFYIIRKLTVTECKRLQTVPDDYVFPVSDTQAYKMLGNGWTVDVIAHILSYCPNISTEPLEVLSMYDGMSCAHLALDKLGAHVDCYYATEIDKYAIKTTQYNYPKYGSTGGCFSS